MAATYLDRILESHRRGAQADTRSLDALIEQAAQAAPTRGFRSALADAAGLAVIS